MGRDAQIHVVHVVARQSSDYSSKAVTLHVHGSRWVCRVSFSACLAYRFVETLLFVRVIVLTQTKVDIYNKLNTHTQTTQRSNDNNADKLYAALSDTTIITCST